MIYTVGEMAKMLDVPASTHAPETMPLEKIPAKYHKTRKLQLLISSSALRIICPAPC